MLRIRLTNITPGESTVEVQASLYNDVNPTESLLDTRMTFDADATPGAVMLAIQKDLAERFELHKRVKKLADDLQGMEIDVKTDVQMLKFLNLA